MKISNILGYVKSSRVHTVLAVNLLLYGVFKYTELPIDYRFWLIFAFILVTGASTFWQNDYDDRFRDKVQGRTFAFYNHAALSLLAKLGWCFSLIFAVCLLVINLPAGVVAFITLLTCRFYTHLLKTPFLAMVAVAIVDVTPFAYAYAMGGVLMKDQILVLLVFLFMFLMRETIKDMEDAVVDRKLAYKMTLPAMYGYSTSIVFLKVLCIPILLGILGSQEVTVFLVIGAFLLLSVLTSVLHFELIDVSIDATWRRLLAKLPKRTLDIALLVLMLVIVN